MRIPSGVTDQVMYFIAVDATDLKTRETGLTTFTVYRSRDGAASTIMPTPTITEVDATNMAGVYKLLLDEDMTIAAGNDSEEMIFHITQADMAPVDRTIELYRRTVTGGYTLAVEPNGDVSVLSNHTPQTGDGYPILNDPIFGNSALNDSLGNLSSGIASGGAVNATGVVIATGTETLTYTATHEQDGIVHEIAAVTGNTDFYYTVTLGGSQSCNSVTWRGYVQSNGDSVSVQYYDWDAASWKTELVVLGANGTTFAEETIHAVAAYTGTGANLGEVRIRALSASATNIATDRLRFNYTASFESVGYAGGQVWINTVGGAAGTEPYRNGTADNQCLLLADAITIAAALPTGLDKFAVSNASSIPFVSAHTNEVWSGEGWTLALGGQDVSGTHINHCNDVSGIGTSPSGHVHIIDSHMGALTLGECHITRGSFKSTFNAGAAGNYHFENAKSGVAGAGVPTLTFSGLGAPSTMNIRGWEGGGVWVFDVNCTASIEVLVGGTHNITTGGGSIEFRGTPKNLIVNTSGTGTTNIVVWSGCPITITGSGGIINIYGLHNGITDTSTGTTVTDLGADVTDLPKVLSDTNELQLDDVPGLIAALNDIAATEIVSAGAITTLAGAVANVDSVDVVASNADMRGTDGANTTAPDNASIAAILTDTGTTLPAQVAAQNNFNPATDAVANVTLVGTTAVNSDMRGTDGANTTAPDNTSIAAILADTNELQLDWANGGRLDLLLDQIIADIAAQNNISAADVNAQVNDVLNVDALAELTGVPAANAAVGAKINWLFLMSRNKGTQTATTKTIRNDVDTADVATSTVSADGTTFTRNEFV